MKKPQPEKTKDHNHQQMADLENKWKRALADYQNLEKRVAAQQGIFIKLANVGLLEKLLPIFDDLKRAAGHLKDSGIQMILNQLEKVLDEERITKIKALGETFDATKMECVELTEGEPDKVVAVVLDGYQLDDTVIRPAKVLVGRSSINKEKL